MQWQIGDRAICITPGSRLEGLEVEITSVLWSSEMLRIDGSLEYLACYDIDPGFQCPDQWSMGWAAQPKYLRTIPDKYDGLSVTTWDAVPPAFRLSRFPEKVVVRV